MTVCSEEAMIPHWNRRVSESLPGAWPCWPGVDAWCRYPKISCGWRLTSAASLVHWPEFASSSDDEASGSELGLLDDEDEASCSSFAAASGLFDCGCCTGSVVRQPSLGWFCMMPERVPSRCEKATSICRKISSSVLSWAARRCREYTSSKPLSELGCPKPRRCPAFAPTFASQDKAVQFRLCDETVKTNLCSSFVAEDRKTHKATRHTIVEGHVQLEGLNWTHVVHAVASVASVSTNLLILPLASTKRCLQDKMKLCNLQVGLLKIGWG